jgi:hypothetical protein
LRAILAKLEPAPPRPKAPPGTEAGRGAEPSMMLAKKIK